MVRQTTELLRKKWTILRLRVFLLRPAFTCLFNSSSTTCLNKIAAIDLFMQICTHNSTAHCTSDESPWIVLYSSTWTVVIMLPCFNLQTFSLVYQNSWSWASRMVPKVLCLDKWKIMVIPLKFGIKLVWQLYYILLAQAIPQVSLGLLHLNRWVSYL